MMVPMVKCVVDGQVIARPFSHVEVEPLRVGRHGLVGARRVPVTYRGEIIQWRIDGVPVIIKG